MPEQLSKRLATATCFSCKQIISVIPCRYCGRSEVVFDIVSSANGGPELKAQLSQRQNEINDLKSRLHSESQRRGNAEAECAKLRDHVRAINNSMEHHVATAVCKAEKECAKLREEIVGHIKATTLFRERGDRWMEAMTGDAAIQSATSCVIGLPERGSLPEKVMAMIAAARQKVME